MTDETNELGIAVSNGGRWKEHQLKGELHEKVMNGWYSRKKNQALIPTGAYPVVIRTLSLPGDSLPAPEFPEPVLATPGALSDVVPKGAAASRGDMADSWMGDLVAGSMDEPEVYVGMRLLSPDA